MKQISKMIFNAILILFALNATAQVGINNSDPKALLDVVAKKGTEPDGVLIPRLTATEVQAMDSKVGEAQNSMLVYVTQTTTTALSSKCKNIDSEGFYYYDHKDGQVWKKLGIGAYTAGAGIEIGGGVVSATGLEGIKNQYRKTGWRLIGRNPADYLDIGTNAVDLSVNGDPSNKRGASGLGAVAMGFQTVASGNNSVVMGFQTVASGNFSVAMGTYNKDISDNLFSVGSGRIESLKKVTRKNAFAITVKRRASSTFNFPIESRVAINKDAADMSAGGAQLQVNGLIQSEGIGYYTDDSATKVVVADDKGVFKTIDKSSLTGATYTAGIGITIAGGVVSATGLEGIPRDDNQIKDINSEYNFPYPHHSWRLIGRNADRLLPTGYGAVDLSSNYNSNYPIGKTGASGYFSFATGLGTTASGDRSTAIGTGTTASGDYSTAIGAFSTASGDYSTAIGVRATASGGYSTAIGERTTASGTTSTAMGYQTIASGEISTAMGLLTIASGKNSVAMGKYNFESADNLLSVGIGADDTHRQNGFIITQDGKVGIGLNTIVSSSPYKLLVNGYIISTGQQIYSDSRLKKDIQPLASGWQVVSQLRPVQYYWNDLAQKKRGQKDTQLQYGFIAQEVEKVLPNVVREVQEENHQSYKSINYTEIIPILTKTIQEQQQQLQTLEERIKALEAKLSK